MKNAPAPAAGAFFCRKRSGGSEVLHYLLGVLNVLKHLVKVAAVTVPADTWFVARRACSRRPTM
jgi:hypothetical protein